MSLSGFAFSILLLFVVLAGISLLDVVFGRMRSSFVVVITPVVYFIVVSGFSMCGAAIDRPDHVCFADNSVFWGTVFAGAVLVLMMLDATIQSLTRPPERRDVAYYPHFRSLLRSVSSLKSRLVLIVGGLLLIGYYAATVLYLYRLEQYAGGLIWPPERVFFTCVVGWGILWVADCLSRPGYGTLWAAVGFLVIGLLLIPASTEYVLRE